MSKPKPREPFDSIEEAIKVLKPFGENFEIPSRVLSREEIIHKLVGGNITRSFANLPTRPSEVFRGWGESIYDNFLSELQSSNNEVKFKELIFKYADSLIEFWYNLYGKQSEKIGFGPATKITNLLVKTIQESGYSNPGQIKLMHVPFDVYTLRPLKKIINELTMVNYGVRMPPYPTMSYVVNKEHYILLQKAIQQLSFLSGTVPIAFEYLCWNLEH